MLESLFSSFSEDIGIDLGTANTLVYVRGRGITVREASVVALHRKTKALLAVGEEARRMVGKTPENILAVRPLREGVISDFEVAERMLQFFIVKARTKPSRFLGIFRPRIIIGVPSGITEVERRAVRDAALHLGAREVFLIEEPLAAAIGAGLPVSSPEGSLVVDIGGGTTEVAVISLGGIVVGKSLRVAGDEMTEAISEYARRKFNLLLGDQTAEKVKFEVGNAFEGLLESAAGPSELVSDGERVGLMRGRDLKTGLPKAVTLSEGGAREALQGPLGVIVSAVKDVIEATPPELLSDVLKRGAVLTGGGSLLRGIDRLLASAAGLPVLVADDPMTCVVRGCGELLEKPNLLERVRLR